MKIGFIGAGNMASAMIGGILKNGTAAPEDIIGSGRSERTKKHIQDELGIRLAPDNAAAAKFADVIFLSVKPEMYETVINEIKDEIEEDQLIVSIAPGKSLEWLEQRFGRPVKIVRTMPNTPAQVGEGITAACANAAVTGADKEKITRILESFGRAEFIPENLMEAASAVSGSAPAFIYMVIEAMADAGVALGMPRSMAYTFAAQTVKGSGEMVLESGEHPGRLKDDVCSPGGSTIAGVRSLEENGLRSSMIEAIIASKEKADTL